MIYQPVLPELGEGSQQALLSPLSRLGLNSSSVPWAGG